MPALYIREPVNALTHLGAMFAAIPAAAFLLRMAWGDRVKFYGMLVYSCSLILCFAGSGLFHAVPEAYSEPFGLLDHIGIYLLIAGTVTPIGLIVLHGRWRVALVGGIWLLAATGIVERACSASRICRCGRSSISEWAGSAAHVFPAGAAAVARQGGADVAGRPVLQRRRGDQLDWDTFPPEFSQHLVHPARGVSRLRHRRRRRATIIS